MYQNEFSSSALQDTTNLAERAAQACQAAQAMQQDPNGPPRATGTHPGLGYPYGVASAKEHAAMAQQLSALPTTTGYMRTMGIEDRIAQLERRLEALDSQHSKGFGVLDRISHLERKVGNSGSTMSLAEQLNQIDLSAMSNAKSGREFRELVLERFNDMSKRVHGLDIRITGLQDKDPHSVSAAAEAFAALPPDPTPEQIEADLRIEAWRAQIRHVNALAASLELDNQRRTPGAIGLPHPSLYGAAAGEMYVPNRPAGRKVKATKTKAAPRRGRK